MSHDSSLSILDHDGPIQPPVHVVIDGVAYWLESDCLTFAPYVEPMPWEDGIGRETDLDEAQHDAITALLYAKASATPPRFTAQRIGGLAVSSPGADTYYLLTVPADDAAPTVQAMREAFRQSVYNHGNGPGTVFCHDVSVFPTDSAYNEGHEFIGVARVRWDV